MHAPILRLYSCQQAEWNALHWRYRYLIKRIYEHKHDLVEGFTKKNQVHMLVHYEETGDVHSALAREKQLKNWQRKWKLELIEKTNPQWNDLYPQLIG